MPEPTINAHNKEEYPPMHTAEHVLNRTMVLLYGCPRSRNAHIERKKSKCDYLLDHCPDAEEVRRIEEQVNGILSRGLPVTISYVDRDEAVGLGVDLDKLPGDASATLRIVRIGDYDICACAGAHVSSTSEVGLFKILSHDYDPDSGVWRVRWKVFPPNA